MRLYRGLPLPEEVRKELFNRPRIELWGGLGDGINHINWLPCYAATYQNGSGPTAVLISSHNPHVFELFQHVPSDDLVIVDIGFHVNFMNDAWRQSVALPPCHCDHSRGAGPVKYFPSPGDLAVLRMLPKGPLVVVHPTAGHDERAFPAAILDQVEQACREAGATAVVVGRSYAHSYADGSRVKEPAPLHAVRGDVTIDLSGALTVAGVAALVERAAGTVTTHSSVCLMSWHIKRPNFLIYNEVVKRDYVPRGLVGYLFGAGWAGNDHMEFSDFSAARLRRWLVGICGGGK